MTSSGQRIEWSRLLIEGGVIVASILLAFAIDAWWENRQERRAEGNQLLSIASELESNAKQIREKLDVLEVADAAAKQFISWTGPEPQLVGEEKFSETFRNMYSLGSFALLRGASEMYLAGNGVDLTRHHDMRDAIADWYAAGDELERQYAWLREAHATLGSYLLDTVPRLSFERSHPLLGDLEVSRFPFDQSNVLSDPRFESRVSLYLIRLRFVQILATDLVESQAELLVHVRLAAES